MSAEKRGPMGGSINCLRGGSQVPPNSTSRPSEVSVFLKLHQTVGTMLSLGASQPKTFSCNPSTVHVDAGNGILRSCRLTGQRGLLRHGTDSQRGVLQCQSLSGLFARWPCTWGTPALCWLTCCMEGRYAGRHDNWGGAVQGHSAPPSQASTSGYLIGPLKRIVGLGGSHESCRNILAEVGPHG